MKIWISMLACAMVLGGSHVPAQSLGGKASDTISQSVRVIRENAELVDHNAGIYQWRRVNLEVDRIVAAARDVRKHSNAALTEKVTVLTRMVSELRDARLHRRSDTLQEISRQIIKHLENL